MSMLSVYDNFSCDFRPLDKKNFNDDYILGTVFFHRDAIDLITHYFRIIGYILDQDGCYKPIDVRHNDIALFEGTYNCFPLPLQRALIPYNLREVPNTVWSSFFLRWQFMNDESVFNNSGSFIELCSRIIADKEYIKKLNYEKVNLIFPVNYKELSVLIRNLRLIFEFEFYNKAYFEDTNYLFDSLVNGYHVNMSDSDVELYSLQACDLILKQRGWKNV